MQDQEREELTEKSNSLRIDLKVWEKNFAAANNGQKASRDDIKKHPDIAAKYKEYNKSRDILSGKLHVPPKESKRQTPQKRKRQGGHAEGTKRRQVIETPSRGAAQPWELDPYDSPSVVRNLFTPSKKTVIGPTPQKDGQVLGLFDLLQEDGTPSKAKADNATLQGPIQATPRKSRPDDVLKLTRTPSSTTRSILHPFATPLKNRTLNSQGGHTPSSTSKLHFSTPSFLRRDTHRNALPPINEDADLSPQMARVPRKPLVRGLSSMLAGLRKMEEEAADEDLDALHEMENETPGPGTGSGRGSGNSSKPPTKPAAPAAEFPKDIVVEDSQPRLPLGGFDDEAMFDSSGSEGHDRDGQPLKVYKKKGQKRTTRRVKMKPVRSKPSTSLQPPAPIDEDSEDELTQDAVPETQAEAADASQAVEGLGEEGGDFAEARNFDSDSQSEYTASEGGTRYKRPDQQKRKVMGRDGKIRRGASKVTALANQNFKRLKLRNAGAKGGPGIGSRFRRRK
ncbi:DNA replication regulator [Lachnellula hyalina]|uniref:DNA replication regulator SLD2 n=1 Tax=Lachnellula hyalina TaxID=1316788 RepID=A0A8H8QVX9_9HELO|nr:DNA replication regulator [Lachnellula hyalina]TVY23091.1 DNA replication regulator [Lachnellula hyalina]